MVKYRLLFNMSNAALDIAYFALGIDSDASLADEDVGIAFYKNYKKKSSGKERRNDLRNALGLIAEARRSRFLRFLATIGELLNEKNVAVLANKTFAASPEPENVEENIIGAEAVDEAALGESQDLASKSSESEMEMDAFGEYYATSESISSQLRTPSSSEASVSSGNEMSADSDFSEEVGGMFFDRRIWRCEECCAVLVDWECPNGHELMRCKTCGWQLDNGPCQRCLGICGACGGKSVDGLCGSCGAGEESEEEDTIAFDKGDGIWRCIYCQWEVEADNETDGNCHCLNDRNEAHFIDLSDCLDYEPADSCSSEDDSSDSESNSDAESFIDDAEISMDGIAPDAATENINLAALYPAREVSNIMKAALMAKGVKLAGDKENVEPIARSNGIEIIDAPTADGPTKFPTDIIDCESMDI